MKISAHIRKVARVFGGPLQAIVSLFEYGKDFHTVNLHLQLGIDQPNQLSQQVLLFLLGIHILRHNIIFHIIE